MTEEEAMIAAGQRTKVEGRRWYGAVYRTAYRLGLKVWDHGVPAPGLVELVQEMAPGRALDLGCGTGTNSVYLAQRGWDVTGVDMVPRALGLARRKAERAGVAPRFVEGDVTRLRDFGVGDGYTLLIDAGCFHTLPADLRADYVDGVSEAAGPGSTLLLYGFVRPPRFAPMRAGVSTGEVRERFGGRWELVDDERADRRFDFWRYRLRRQAPSA
jgi:SAM-dependent methyltransferase